MPLREKLQRRSEVKMQVTGETVDPKEAVCALEV